jgi:malate dehydrogenase (oxaloacetate-decarboxylating)(NADP+)
MTYQLEALDYHRHPFPGKIAIRPTKPLASQLDLCLAYSPGVAAACERIQHHADEARDLTARANLVGVVTNGTAVMGLGAIGPLAAKPVMEGKAVLFKHFAGIDVFDIELNENDPHRLIDIIAALEPTFGAINLEDIKSPECFFVEERLRQRMKIPVFHDDQHGTAVVVAAAILNGLRTLGKDLRTVKFVTSGAGAAALACLDLLVTLGLPRRHIWLTDINGVVYAGRESDMDAFKARFAQPTSKRALAEVIADADVFLGLSAGRVLTEEMVAAMAPKPLILALANPVPEIRPEAVARVRDDALVATGRSDYPNQVNNVLCFPYIFRGALDTGATAITPAMELAAACALADLAQLAPESSQHADLCTPRPALLPTPFDARLLPSVAAAVAQAAISSGVATRPIADLDAYRQALARWRDRTDCSQGEPPQLARLEPTPKAPSASLPEKVAP